MCNNKSDSTIKFRINQELKQDFKELADRQGTTMSKLLCSYIELELKKDLECENILVLEQRINKCDDLLRDKQKGFRKTSVQPKISFFKRFKLWGNK